MLNQIRDWNLLAISHIFFKSTSFAQLFLAVHTQTMTMLAHAPYGDLNHSTNPTFVASSDPDQFVSGSNKFVEAPKSIKNVVYSQFTDVEPEFKKVVYISKVGLYDEHKNLIGIAKIATPVRKTEDHSYVFKLKLDI